MRSTDPNAAVDAILGHVHRAQGMDDATAVVVVQVPPARRRQPVGEVRVLLEQLDYRAQRGWIGLSELLVGDGRGDHVALGAPCRCVGGAREDENHAY